MIGLFLIAVAAGHVAALVQLYAERAARGEFLPGPTEVAKLYLASGETGFEALPLEQLAQNTQAQLLTLALLYAATGLAFSFTRYSPIARRVFGPGPLVLLLATIVCWWLARILPAFAYMVFFTNLAFGILLAVQLGGCFWDLCKPETKPPWQVALQNRAREGV